MFSIKKKNLFALMALFLIMDLYCSAQPTLPDISGKFGKNEGELNWLDKDSKTIKLSWICQYSGVRDILVKHSIDSLANYDVIGHIYKPLKGVQSFSDPHPVAGRNFYKLHVIFNSGLEWTSNRICVVVNPDSIPVIHHKHNSDIAPDVSEIATSQVFPPKEHIQKPITQKTETTSNTVPHSLKDSGTNQQVHFLPPEKRMKFLLCDDTAICPDLFIASKYVFVDPATGHVLIVLPNDVKAYHYSLKILDNTDKVIYKVPHLSTPKIIMDKRNFNHNGVYSFILKRDNLEFERGNILIK